MSLVLKCDSCGATINPKDDKIWHIDIRYTEGYGDDKDLIEGEYVFNNNDLCDNCIKLVSQFLTLSNEDKTKMIKGDNVLSSGDTKPAEKIKRKYTKHSKEENPQADSDNKNPSQNKEIDRGKVMALYNTHNFPLKEIAAEVKASEDDVHKIILEERKKKMQSEK